MSQTAAVMPRVDLLKIGKGSKLHIPHNDRPLCEVGNYNLEQQPDVSRVVGDGVSCRNCLRQAERIAAYL